MNLIESLDRWLFCFINQTMSNPVFDVLMPFLSGNIFFFPAIVLVGLWLIRKDRLRGSLCILMLALIVGPGDKFITNKIKHAIGRPRPHVVIPETRLPAGRTGTVGMPSSHAANWGSAAAILFFYYRRSLWLTVPLGVAVSFSRVYNGVHYPADVFVGALLGATYSALLVWIFDAAWRHLGKKFFPRRVEQLPTLIISAPSRFAMLAVSA
jgi:undecaprenyl-diphosphatase